MSEAVQNQDDEPKEQDQAGAVGSGKVPALRLVKSDFQENEPAEACLPEAQDLKFEQPDWWRFRTVEGLQQRAGVPKEKLRRLVLKELADNGLDLDVAVRVGRLAGGAYFVEDDGPGLDGTPQEIAKLFSIGRPMVSSKLWRLPTRGALGNGLRVVAGAVLVSQGALIVITHNRRLELRPEHAGTTTVVSDTPVDFPVGTRVEISLPGLPDDRHALGWACLAIGMYGRSYEGKSSPWWYDVATFHLLLNAGGSRPVRDLIANLDGCSGAKAGKIVAGAGLSRVTCDSLTCEQAERLLNAARSNARKVTPSRLKGVGPFVEDYAYVSQEGLLNDIPYLVEAWAGTTEGDTTLTGFVNRTPITGSLRAAREKRDIDFYGCGLNHNITTAPKDKHFSIQINVITPFMPITSDGKAPNLIELLDPITKAVTNAVRKAHNPSATDGATQKDVVLDHLDEVVAEVSGNGKHRFNQRQLLYRLRPIVMNEIGEELKEGNYNGIITDYENEHDEIPGMYREPRGTIYHPHTKQTITLGTLMVEEYTRPEWTFNKLVYIEKEGFSEALKDERWPERHDCAIMSSKGFSTRAARDLIDKLVEHDEPVTIFCVHDADAFGTTIYQTLQGATRARAARKVTIVNLGLEPWEAIEMGLEVEGVEKKGRRKAVAQYVLDRDDGKEWVKWLQTKRVELNAMTTPQFIAWLDRKMEEHADGKIVPPEDVISEHLRAAAETRIRARLAERLLKEADFEGRVDTAINVVEFPTKLQAPVGQWLEQHPHGLWSSWCKEPAASLSDIADEA